VIDIAHSLRYNAIKKEARVISIGPSNTMLDIAGIKIGNAQSTVIKTGVTVVTFDKPVLAAHHIMGGAPATREMDALNLEGLVDKIHAIVLSGGSVFGARKRINCHHHPRTPGCGV